MAGAGLLSQIEDVTVADFYSGSINLERAYESLNDDKLIYNICLENAKGDEIEMDAALQLLLATSKTFMTSDEVWDRNQLKKTLETVIVKGQGQFLCLLAGKNTGKSLVLHYLENQFKEKVFVVDLRENSNILHKLVDVLNARQSYFLSVQSSLYDNRVDILKSIVAAVTRTFPIIDSHATEVGTHASKVFFTNTGPPNLHDLVTNLAAGLGCITLIIDEANIALTIKHDTPYEEKKDARNALSYFTTLTKQKQQVCTAFYSNFIVHN